MHSYQHGNHYYIVVQIEIKNGQKRVLIRSPLQVKNNLDVAVDLIHDNRVGIATSTGDAAMMLRKISSIKGKEIGNLPLFYAHKRSFFIQPSVKG